ncbi:hypothetical protein Hokovirus_1_223 [Hokovirus HKV1]|uniref:Uncharacterized protein n=1 Tax=Hokovirus HKV1 TaxID=1977638 RepID=A0A1V0SFC6_9VIRU|nr:hypothetical protein Hokovirus_1_223 [Hokovirus HKV1]
MKVSGPINVIRLEGEFNNKKKILYVFFDVHNNCYRQTHCGDHKVYSFNEYLADNFKGPINYYLELFPYTHKYNKYKSDIYIVQARKLFDENYKLNNNKVIQSINYPNVKFHYIDFRFTMPFEFDVSIKNVINLLNQMNYYFDFNILDNINNKIKELLHNFIVLYNFIFKELKDYKPQKVNMVNNYEEYIKLSFTQKETIYKNFLYKTFSINNLDLYKIIIELVNTFLKPKLEKTIKILMTEIEKIDNILNNLKNEIVYKFKNDKFYIDNYSDDDRIDFIANLLKKSYLIENEELNINAFLIDIYFLRRFLDKNYEGNSIIYTGYYHSTTYINFLVKYYNFDITHYSHLNYEKNEVIKTLKNNFDPFNNQDLLINYNFIQCSDLTNFPKNFE